MKNRKQTQPANHLVLMIKAPELGRVKTRLGKDIGAVTALNFYRHLTTRLIHQLSQSAGWQTHLAITPHSSLHNAHWPEHVSKFPQSNGDLGDRMQAVFDHFAPYPTLIIGSDIPAITPHHISESFKQLSSMQMVFGPSGDGGYWCVGQNNRRGTAQPFKNVRWSTPHALKDTTNNLKPGSYAFTNELKDIDTGADYEKHYKTRKGRWLSA